MKNDDGTFALPGAFLPAAERFHLASRVDRWVLRHAADWMKRLPRIGAIDMLNINLSGQSVGDRAFHAWAKELLVQAGSEVCKRLCLEITETATVTNLADAAIFIETVRGWCESGTRRLRRWCLILWLPEDTTRGLSQDRWTVHPRSHR